MFIHTHMYADTQNICTHKRYMEMFMKSGRLGDESPLLLLQVPHSLPRTTTIHKMNQGELFSQADRKMLCFEVGSCISKPEICIEDICTVPSGQVF